MSAAPHAVGQKLRITAKELQAHQQSGAPVTILDARNEKAWASSSQKIRGAARIRPDDWHVEPAWPKQQWTVVY
jgi:hypothetical protein